MRKRGAPRLLSAMADLSASDVDVAICSEAHIVTVYSGQRLAVGVVSLPAGSQALTLHLSDQVLVAYRCMDPPPPRPPFLRPASRFSSIVGSRWATGSHTRKVI